MPRVEKNVEWIKITVSWNNLPFCAASRIILTTPTELASCLSTFSRSSVPQLRNDKDSLSFPLPLESHHRPRTAFRIPPFFFPPGTIASTHHSGAEKQKTDNVFTKKFGDGAVNLLEAKVRHFVCIFVLVFPQRWRFRATSTRTRLQISRAL